MDDNMLTFLLMTIIPASIASGIGVIITMIGRAKGKGYIFGPIMIASGIIFAVISIIVMLPLL